METIITLKIDIPANEWDKLERRAEEVDMWSSDLLADVINDALMGELGIIGSTTVTKIE